MGSQLYNVEAGLTSGHGVDLSAIEDQMLSRCSAASLARRIAGRLAQLPTVQVQALRLHFRQGEGVRSAPEASLPFGVDVAAILLGSARKLVVRQLYAAAREELRALRKALPKLSPVHDHLGRFLRLRNEARLTRAQRHLPLSTEVLRAALHRASKEERQLLASQADALVSAAVAAYESVRLPFEGRARLVNVEDPRPWKRRR